MRTGGLLGGSFHGTAPEFFGSVPEKKLLRFLRKTVVTASALITRMVNIEAAAIQISMCDHCDGLHVHMFDRQEQIIAGAVYETPEQVDGLIRGLQEGRDLMLMRQSKRATKQ